MAEESADDDYMSDAILEKCNDSGPGLVPERVKKIYQKEIQQHEKNQLHRQINKPRRVLENEQRDEGLKNALNSDNKGFRLMEKMGYKPGTAIGKTGIGKLEPVSIELKVDREGLGQKTERKRKETEMKAMRAVMAQKRQRHELEWRENVRSKFVDRETEKDMMESQKVCEQLDAENGLEVPVRLFFWPAVLLPQADESEEDEEHVEVTNPEDALLSLPEKLELVTDYLRSTYHYCIWCGTRFDNDTDLETNCPGNNSGVH